MTNRSCRSPDGTDPFPERLTRVTRTRSFSNSTIVLSLMIFPRLSLQRPLHALISKDFKRTEVMMMALNDYSDSWPFHPRSLGQITHRPFAALDPVIDARLRLQQKAGEITEVVVDQTHDLADQLLTLGMVTGMFVRWLRKTRHPPGRRRQDLSRIAAEALHTAGNVVDVALQDGVPALAGRHL